MKKKYIARNLIVAVIALCCVGYTLASTNTITITFIIPSQYSHSISVYKECTTADFACRENDATKDGTQDNINITTTAGVVCQNASESAINITNDGNNILNITMNVTAALPAGVELKAYNHSTAAGANGYEDDCTLGENESFTATACKNISINNNAVIGLNLEKDQIQVIWLACDFEDFNSGVATDSIENTIQTVNYPT